MSATGASVTRLGIPGAMLYGRTGDKVADAPEFDDLYATARSMSVDNALLMTSRTSSRRPIPVPNKGTTDGRAQTGTVRPVPARMT